MQLQTAEKEIRTLHPTLKNPNSPKQVSQALFGTPDQPTNKYALEAMSHNNVLAKLVLQYRTAQQQLRRLEKKMERIEQQQRDPDANRNTAASSSYDKDDDPIILIDTSSFIFRAMASKGPLKATGLQRPQLGKSAQAAGLHLSPWGKGN